MCGRFTLACPPESIAAEFGVDVPPEYEPHYNIAPSQPVLVIGRASNGVRRAAYVRWGLVPHWAESPNQVGRTINARAETLLSKRTFREAFLFRRCLVVADGFYEWRRETDRRRPFRFHLDGERLLAFAGIWDPWRGEAGEILHSCSIITTESSPRVAPIHDRMPAILGREDREAWLEPEATTDRLAALLRPYAADDLQAYEVSATVNAVANDSPACIAPVQR